MELTFTEILWFIIAVSVAIIAVKITISFDINEYLKNRNERLLLKAKNYCPHARFVKTPEGKYGVQSNFVSPPGTTNYICTTCQLVVYDVSGENMRIQYFLENPKELSKQTEKFEKIIRKAGLS